MTFAFIIMGNFNPEKDTAYIHNKAACIVGVSTIEQACTVAKQLQKEGVDCIELCGAFEQEGAEKIIQATQNKLPIGYVTHLPAQNALYDALFSKNT